MAFRLSQQFRPIAVALASLAAAALVLPVGAVATPSTPGTPPTVASAQKQLGQLAVQNSQLVEQYDQAQLAVQTQQAKAAAARTLAAAAAKGFEAARTKLGAAAAAEYEGGSFSATGALLTSNSGQSYLDKLDTLSMLSAHTSQVVDRMTAAKRQADATRRAAGALLTSVTAKRDALAVKRHQVQQQVDKYTALLAKLTAAQRRAFQHQLNPTVSNASVAQATKAIAVHAPSKAAGVAVQFALAQVGKPYVFGSAGPGSYDCSGLTMASWRAGGVSLPHSAAGQYGYGHHVSFGQLQPGDLMFFYQPIGHVTIYIGSGLMVSAPTTGENVSVVPANEFGSSFTGATRLTG